MENRRNLTNVVKTMNRFFKRPPYTPTSLSTEQEMELPSSISRQVPLRAEPDIHYIPDRNRDIIGHVAVGFRITNTTQVPAIIPFIALPVLGHLSRSDQDWYEDLILSDTGRRMMRFTAPAGFVLDAGKTTQPLTILFPFTAIGAGTLSVASGVRQNLDRLDDIKLHYVIGAGNFPSNRAVVTIPADRIREAISRHLNSITVTGWFAKGASSRAIAS